MSNRKLASILVAVLLLGVAHAAYAATTPAQKCAIAKHRAAVRKTAAETACYRQAYAKGMAVKPTCLATAEKRFTAAIAKAEAKGGCVVSGDAAAIESAVDTCVSSFAGLTLDTTNSASGDCTPSASCTAGHTCISLVDNTAQATFGLRLSQLSITKPTALGSGILGSLLGVAVQPSLNGCNLNGTGSFSWLVQFDKGAPTLKIGTSKPVADPTQGYSFVNEIAFGTTIAPVTTPMSLALDGSFSSTAADVVLAVYLDGTASSGFPLPLSALSLSGQVSADQNCVGRYNSQGLVPPSCTADGSNPTFLNGGTAHGYITLEAADAAIIDVLNMSLCVLLTGDPGSYGDGGSPTRCKRSAGTIIFTGDYCSTTNMPGDCADAVELAASFAASAIKINN